MISGVSGISKKTMLKAKSFKFSDSEGINELLSKHSISKGANIFVSNGELVIPFEDTLPPTNEQIICTLSEQRNEAIMQKELIEHSNKVMEATAQKNIKKQKVFDEFMNQKYQNEHEIERLELNIKFFNERIEELSK